MPQMQYYSRNKSKTVGFFRSYQREKLRQRNRQIQVIIRNYILNCCHYIIDFCNHIYREHLEATLKLCSRCNQYTQKILSIQEKRYNLNSVRMNNRMVV